jgi:hypothetical protein
MTMAAGRNVASRVRLEIASRAPSLLPPQRSYAEVYAELAAIISKTRRSSRRRDTVGHNTARNGIYTRSTPFKNYMQNLGFRWVPTMQIGTGCKVHLATGELPSGRLVRTACHGCLAVAATARCLGQQCSSTLTA